MVFIIELPELKGREKLINRAIGEKSWIIEGVYSRGVEGIVKKSDLVICLDLNPLILIKRVVFRFIKRKIMGREDRFKDLPALIKYAYIYRNERYLEHKALVEKYKAKFICLKSRKELDAFMRRLLDKK